MTKILAIDAGNTRLKWGLFNAIGDMIENGACDNSEITKITLPEAMRVVISNVAGEQVKKQLGNILSQYNSARWITATAKECGVYNNYDQPVKLGTDRWAALIAAWHIKQTTCVVVSAGTAVTIDALSVNHGQGNFIGGIILPGIHLMQQSLGVATAQLPIIPSDKLLSTDINQYKNIFAKNTADAMRYGALHAVSGAILQMTSALEQHCKNTPIVLICGGDAQLIKNNLFDDVTNQVLIVDNLVLRGLYLIESFMLQTLTKSEQQ